MGLPRVTPVPLREGQPSIGDGRLHYILGPCVIENEKMIWQVAERVKALSDELRVPVVFKASYDKANRTSLESYRGPGLAAGVRLLGQVSEKLGLAVTTDVHSPEEAQRAAEHIDILQIPAFLCRQTDLIVAAARTGRVVNVKKGQFLAPWDVGPILRKAESTGNRRILLTERGTTFGYNNLVADMRSLPWLRETGYPVIFDATHSVQRPGGAGGSTSGDGILAPVLARAAVAAGCDGIFAETHPNPTEALSDGPNQIPLDEITEFIRRCENIYQAAHAEHGNSKG